MSEIADVIAALTPDQRALLSARLADQGLGRLDAGTITRRREGGPAPLSYSQQRLWVLDQLDPAAWAYHIPVGLRITGLLRIDALERAMNRIVERHESLRTTFHAVDGTPVQLVAPRLSVPLAILDLGSHSPTEREAAVQEHSAEELRRPFDLGQGPLLRTTLLRLGPTEHILLLTIHHIVADGWSMGVVFRELGAFYSAECQGSLAQLPVLPIQYPDYAVWQVQRLQGPTLEGMLDQWRELLAGAPTALDLPTDHPRPPVQDLRGGQQSMAVAPELCAGLRTLGQQEGSTLFMTLLAGFNGLLARHSGQDDVVVGVPIAGRTRAELEGLIGFFLNSLPLRTSLAGDPSFRELLRRVRDVAVKAYTHQDLPFEKLVEAVHPERDLSRTPIFQAFFNLENTIGGGLELPGLRVESVARSTGGSKFDLALHGRQRGEEVSLALSHSLALFEPSTAASLLRRFRVLLEGAVASPETPLSRLPLLTPEERRSRSAPRPAGRASEPFPDFPAAALDHSIAERFAQQVAADPGHLAVKSRGRAWSYRRLHQESTQIRTRIQQVWSGGPSRVALLMGHDAPMLAAILGVLEAGHAYVPLDPGHPEQRLRLQLQDAEPAVVLADEPNLAFARSLAPAGVSVLSVAPAIGEQPPLHSDPVTPAAPEAPAYLLYTSGTSGQPKAVLQSHRNALHWCRTYSRSLRIGPADRLTLLSSYAFDAAVMDIFAALLNGTTLHPLDLKAELPRAVIERIRAEGITVLHATPTVLRHLVGSLPAGELVAPSVRMVVLGGELATRQDAELVKAHFPAECVLVNGLGPTESTLALQYRLEADAPPPPRHSLPIGYPVDGAQVVLLDEQGNETDVFGEIAIRSPYVALGYWRRPDLTEAAFRGNPGSADRLYRTGDLARLLPDGALEHLGRKDHQVKLRGFRVELGEIEKILNHHPAVQESAVLLRKDAPDGPALVAYVVPRSGPEPSEATLRTHLRSRLPDYMVPQACVILERLPLLGNGKLDWRRLPLPTLESRVRTTEFVAPRTPVEERICAIWLQVLKLGQAGIHDNFFELGGHSLMATQVVARIRTQLGVDLPLRTMFEQPTIEGLALAVVTRQAQGEAGELESLLAELEELSGEDRDPPPLRPLNRDAFRQPVEGGTEPSSFRRGDLT